MVPRVLIGAALIAAFLLPPGGARADSGIDVAQTTEGALYYFWREDCPYCRRADEWLGTLAAAHPDLEIRRVEVVRDAEGRARFREMMGARGAQASGVPTFILDARVWVGFTPSLAEQIEAEVVARRAGTTAPAVRPTLDLGPLGVVDLGARPMAAATVLIAFVDGFNPCSLWVLTVLIAMVLGTRSRARVALVGVTFLIVTASIYGLFIVGLFAAVGVAGHLGWITIVVAILAFLFGAVNVKDYFAFKWGLSFTIPERFKPAIYRGSRKVREDRPLLVTLGITVALAAGVALIELPCTAGFPVIWTTLVSEAGVGGGAFAGLLGLYLFVYLAVELGILTVAVVTLRASRMQDAHGRTLKLFGGMVMIALAVVLLVDPSLMERLSTALLVVGGAVAASGVVLLVDVVRRRAGAKRAPQGPGSE